MDDEWMQEAMDSYDVTRRPSKGSLAAVGRILADTKDYWDAIGLEPRVLLARSLTSHGGHSVGQYMNGSAGSGSPIILILYSLAKKAESDGRSRDQLEITLLHEPVHAFADSAVPEEERIGPEEEEDLAEMVGIRLFERSIDPDRLRAMLEGALAAG